MTKEYKGVVYAESEKEAEELLLLFCDRIDFSREWISAATWKNTLEIACTKEHGIDTAERAVLKDMQDRQSATQKTARREKISGDRDEVLGQIEGVDTFDDHAVSIFKQVCAQYIDGGGLNMTFGPKLSKERYDDLCGHWRRVGGIAANADDKVFRGFDHLPVENKEEKGKGTTGDTLERRKKQGNFFCTVVNIRFNIHINIS
ncbi:hypothetical protein [Streptomyces sp. Je 1-369]|uniref:hypothetical protein n=1 Tax=Streptomyces sp. Je 1-369 TaxID=2966192 RepID=UPI00228659BB|nr:hypothetical protein [Streptomyces sp. Je 1-369]WAL93871.1 hypothetical protein NOO62_04795 [Streptomyces sp. Je 1-369]